ncbi:methyl-accepting chemotaxis protein [Neobacillus muris]|uniref:methyl-accepting chemotaxis protein n=1 Tax=Neobacillus muris TaxID=2941334 RepID=UPI00203C9BF4|nr:methyl-accepting chemotaxis protein [Neobacillus muris]
MKSLRTKLITFCLLLLAIPSLIIGTVGYETSKSHLEQSGKIQLKNNVRLVIGMIDVLDEQVKRGDLTLKEAQERVKVYILGKKDNEGHRPINKNIDIGKNGYYFIIDESGLELANPTIEGQNLNGLKDQDGKAIVDSENQKPLAEAIIDKAKNGGGYTYYDWALPDNPDKKAEKITYSEFEPNWGWIVSAGSYMMDFNSGASQILNLLLITLGAFLLIGAIFSWVFSSQITKPIKKMADHARSVAEGNLMVDPIKVKNKDEIGQLADGFNTMVSSLKGLIFQVGSSAEQVAAASEQLTASAEQTSKSTEQIMETIESVTEGSENQVNGVKESSTTMNEISIGIGQIAFSTSQVSNSAINTSQRASDGNETIQTAVEQMNSIHKTVNGLAQSVEGLGLRSQEIGQIIEVITDISTQTNLLALNAAIEAARAGEHGRGFAVVADEVRKLAEKSAESANQIGQLISMIQEDTNQAVQSMEKATKEVDEGIGVVHAAGESFGHILASINEVTVQIEEVSAAVEEMAAGTAHVDESINKISKIAEETLARTRNVSAVAGEQSVSMDEIVLSAASLAKMAEELNQSFQKFKI